MKRLFLLLLVSVVCLFVDAQKKEVEVHPLQQTTSSEGSGHSRTPEPSISAYIEDGNLTISIERTLGYVSTLIEDANGTEVDIYYEYVNGTSTYVMNVASLTPSTYNLFFVFADGREYCGVFEIVL